MTDERPTTLHLFDDTTATETTITGVNTATSSSTGTEFYYHLAIVVIGVIGTAANGFILYALVASKQHKKLALIVNQNALDLYGCIFLIITYSVKLCNIDLTGLLGYWLCMLILNDNMLWWGAFGSTINLAIITIDRYLKVVHAAWSNKRSRNWVTYSAMAFAWIGSTVYIATLLSLTTTVIDGVCYSMIYSNDYIRFLGSIALSSYYIILLIFIFCYWRILLVVHRQANIMAVHAAAGAGTPQMSQIQTNVTKTVIIVCGYYAIMWLPLQVSHLIMLSSTDPANKFLVSGYYGSLFIAFLYMCTNPFIYVTKFEPVKEVLLRLIPCKNASAQSSGTSMLMIPTGHSGRTNVSDSNQ